MELVRAMVGWRGRGEAGAMVKRVGGEEEERAPLGLAAV
jgi:hypothetical protein